MITAVTRRRRRRLRRRVCQATEGEEWLPRTLGGLGAAVCGLAVLGLLATVHRSKVRKAGMGESRRMGDSVCVCVLAGGGAARAGQEA